MFKNQSLLAGVFALLIFSTPVHAQENLPQTLTQTLAQTLTQSWTLASSIERVLQIAPETKVAAANIQASQGALKQADTWQNPSISVRVDNKIGLDSGTGGQDLTQFSINQPLPLFGLRAQKTNVAQAGLDASIALADYQHLSLEQQIAIRFHRLQFATANYKLAGERLAFADKLKDTGRKREQAGDMAILERTRLDLVRETAKQLLDKAEGKHNEALAQFRALLELPFTQTPALPALTPVENLPPLARYIEILPRHPLLSAAHYNVKSAKANVDLVKADRLPKLSLDLYRDRDFLAGREQNSHGIGLTVTVPIWDKKRGKLAETRAMVQQGYAQRDILLRDLKSSVGQSYLHLGHLIEQGEHYRLHVFHPSRRVFEMTNKAYEAGEVEILSLIDANNIYFEAQRRYLELLQEAWLEAAELRFAAGQSFFNEPIFATEQFSGQFSPQDNQ